MEELGLGLWFGRGLLMRRVFGWGGHGLGRVFVYDFYCLDVSISMYDTFYCMCGYDVKSTIHAYSAAIVRHNWTIPRGPNAEVTMPYSAIIEATTNEDRKL